MKSPIIEPRLTEMSHWWDAMAACPACGHEIESGAPLDAVVGAVAGVRLNGRRMETSRHGREKMP